VGGHIPFLAIPNHLPLTKTIARETKVLIQKEFICDLKDIRHVIE
jgi:hypothetical protein